jgi:Asp-tRNA(Asn)/Glu-tRNA(Gln) amidotransferase A subunit family amidase
VIASKPSSRPQPLVTSIASSSNSILTRHGQRLTLLIAVARPELRSARFDGKIVSIKDLFDVAGEPTTAGSVLRRSAAPAQNDAVVVRRLRQAGAIIVGKTNMSEFAFDALA